MEQRAPDERPRVVSRPALISMVVYFALTVVAAGSMPFLPKTMFVFALPQTATIVPRFYVDGELTSWFLYEDFHGVEPDAVLESLQGTETSVLHKQYELRDWLRRHATDTPRPDDVPIEIRMEILTPLEGGGLERREWPVTTGTARRRSR